MLLLLFVVVLLLLDQLLVERLRHVGRPNDDTAHVRTRWLIVAVVDDVMRMRLRMMMVLLLLLLLLMI